MSYLFLALALAPALGRVWEPWKDPDLLTKSPAAPWGSLSGLLTLTKVTGPPWWMFVTKLAPLLLLLLFTWWLLDLRTGLAGRTCTLDVDLFSSPLEVRASTSPCSSSSSNCRLHSLRYSDLAPLSTNVSGKIFLLFLLLLRLWWWWWLNSWLEAAAAKEQKRAVNLVEEQNKKEETETGYDCVTVTPPSFAHTQVSTVLCR